MLIPRVLTGPDGKAEHQIRKVGKEWEQAVHERENAKVLRNGKRCPSLLVTQSWNSLPIHDSLKRKWTEGLLIDE